MATDTRKTAYAIIVYPDSTDIDLMLSCLEMLHLPCAVSPLHNMDVFDRADELGYQNRLTEKKGWEHGVDSWEPVPVVGERKKPHYHVLLTFGTQKKSREQVLAIVHEFNPSINYVMPVSSVAGYIRYMCHLDSDAKYKYNVEDVIAFGHIDLSPLWAINKADRCKAKAQICCWIKNYGILNYCDLVDVVIELQNPALFETVSSEAFFFSKYCEGVAAIATGKAQCSVVVDKVAEAIRLRADMVNRVTGELVQAA